MSRRQSRKPRLIAKPCRPHNGGSDALASQQTVAPTQPQETADISSAATSQSSSVGAAVGQQTSRQELARQVLELRLAGFTYQEICQILGLRSRWQAARLQRLALKQFEHDEPALSHQLDVARLDRLIRSLWRRSVQGDLPTLDRLLKLLQQRERYMRQWAKQTGSETVPRMTLLRALAADRQLEAWLQQHCPTPSPSPPQED